ncbi:MAG TPA: hypothetical protein VI583_14245 [Cyclobacteriaceae bacterium]|nr:hypothetical protein [Cyclobacteriaceae bacterium]
MTFQETPDSPGVIQPLFISEEPVELTLISDFRTLMQQKSQEEPQYQPAELVYKTSSGKEERISLKIRPRGFSRRKYDICSFPPILLNFKKKSVVGTLFEGQDRLKLVTYCKNLDINEAFVLKEFLVYKTYNILTDYSYQVRLAQITYKDINDKQKPITRYGFFIESDKNLPARMNAVLFKDKLNNHDRCDHASLDLFTIFQYMIGNTDWWILNYHNATVLQVPSKLPVPVPYDFDFSGALNTPYASPDEKLPIKTVRERMFRGYCRPAGTYERIIQIFKEKKDAIYAMYRKFELLEERDIETTLKYFDSFYEILDDPKKVIRTFYDNCEISHKHVHIQ